MVNGGLCYLRGKMLLVDIKDILGLFQAVALFALFVALAYASYKWGKRQ